MTEEKNSQRPLNTVRVGSVSGSTWSNQGDKSGKTRVFKTFSFQRSYQDPQSKEWKNFNSFTLATLGNLLLTIILVAVKECMGRKDSDETPPEDDTPT